MRSYVTVNLRELLRKVEIEAGMMAEDAAWQDLRLEAADLQRQLASLIAMLDGRPLCRHLLTMQSGVIWEPPLKSEPPADSPWKKLPSEEFRRAAEIESRTPIGQGPRVTSTASGLEVRVKMFDDYELVAPSEAVGSMVRGARMSPGKSGILVFGAQHVHPEDRERFQEVFRRLSELQALAAPLPAGPGGDAGSPPSED